MLELTELNPHFPREYLKAGVIMSLLSTWVLVGLFYYLNRFTKRRYFTIWTTAWLFYALWLTLNLGLQNAPGSPWMLMLQQWCVGVAAVFLLWGSLRFLGRRARPQLLGLFITFLLTWSYLGAYHGLDQLQTQVPIFGLIGFASVWTSSCFYRYCSKRHYIGAGLLVFGFLLWGSYLASYPFLQRNQDLQSTGLFVSAVLQLFIAVSMIILVLEEVQQSNRFARERIYTQKKEKEVLRIKVHSTEERYRSLFDQASEGIIITAAGDLRILELNRTAERLLGISRAEAPQQSLASFCQVNVSPNAAPKSGREWFPLICEQRPLALVGKDGEVRPAEVDGALIDFEGKPAYQFFLRELTERARLEQQLRQAEKLSALGRMISGIAHELNNPLAVIKGYLDLILGHHELNPRTKADLEKVAHESDRAAKLVRNFLAFARQQTAHREKVDLNELIRRVTELRRRDLVLSGVELSLELTPEITATLADPDQIQQVLINLINNAAQAMADSPPPRRLKITTTSTGEHIQIAVEDSGPGVPKENETKIFEPFFTTKPVGTGTGLGLSIAHGIMTEHKGRILYQPASLGGAGFVLDFPVATAQADPPATTATVRPSRLPARTDGHRAKVLVLDDEQALAQLLGEVLTVLGHTPTVCYSASTALEWIERQDFDVILSDMRMPNIDGKQFYELVKQKKMHLAQRFVFLTGDVVGEETQAFLQSTGNPHLSKPFYIENVKQAVANALEADFLLETA